MRRVKRVGLIQVSVLTGEGDEGDEEGEEGGTDAGAFTAVL